MKPKPFAQPAWIDFQGEEVFRPAEYYSDHVVFEILGFAGKIQVIDYRSSTVQALEAIKSKYLNGALFPQVFNVPAFVSIPQPDVSPLEIELRATNHPYPTYMLWVAVGKETGVPLHDYVINRMNRWDEKRFAFLGLYHRPRESYPIIRCQSAFAYSPLSSVVTR